MCYSVIVQTGLCHYAYHTMLGEGQGSLLVYHISNCAGIYKTT